MKRVVSVAIQFLNVSAAKYMLQQMHTIEASSDLKPTKYLQPGLN